MRDFGAIVRVSPRVMGDRGHDLPMGNAVAAQLVGHQSHGFLALTLQECPKESPGRTRVPTRLDEEVDQVPVLVHGAALGGKAATGPRLRGRVTRLRRVVPKPDAGRPTAGFTRFAFSTLLQHVGAHVRHLDAHGVRDMSLDRHRRI